MRHLLRSAYSRVSATPALRRPLDAIRSHPRVRAFARRHVQLLLARGTTWANIDGALRLIAEAPGRKVAFGPWEGDGATELLYWRPFMRWAQEHFELLPADDGAPFPSGPVRALVEEYRSGSAAPRPLLKRAVYERLSADAAPAGEGIVASWSDAALNGVFSGVPTVAIREEGAAEPDLDLAQRIAAALGTPLTIVDADGLERLANALR